MWRRFPDVYLAILLRHLSAKNTRYLAPRSLIFDPNPFGFVVSNERKDSWDENASSLRHADLFLGGSRLPLKVVSARLNVLARRPKKLLLHGKNQAGRALYYWTGPRAKI